MAHDDRDWVRGILSETDAWTHSAPGKWAGKSESHTPIATINADRSVTITVPHGMSDDHWITCLYAETHSGKIVALQRFTGREEKATLTFFPPLCGTYVTPYAVCNEHGVWRGSPAASLGAESLRFTTTRGGVSGLTFKDVLLNAYGPDGGLFVPESIPQIPRARFAAWATLPMPAIAAHVLELYTDLSFTVLHGMTQRAFARFNPPGEATGVASGEPLPLRRVGSMCFLDASLGNTLAFKDIGQQIVAQLLNEYLGREGRHANILVETSGDTGPAAIDAVRGCEHVDIFCVYPHGRISPVQELQMITVDESNVHVFRAMGNTDENAEVLKELFSDEAFVKVSILLCTVTFHANLAHILTRSP